MFVVKEHPIDLKNICDSFCALAVVSAQPFEELLGQTAHFAAHVFQRRTIPSVFVPARAPVAIHGDSCRFSLILQALNDLGQTLAASRSRKSVGKLPDMMSAFGSVLRIKIYTTSLTISVPPLCRHHIWKLTGTI